jgi:hypothetical protein
MLVLAMAEQTSGSTGKPGSFWQAKPGWCQPWTIVATGAGISLASWVLLQRWWITAPVVGAVLVWWWLFLVLVPAGYEATGGALDPDQGPAD